MKELEIFRWYLPPRPGSGPRAKPYLSRWKMSAADAAERGAIRCEPTSREVLQVPETCEERLQLARATDTSWPGHSRDDGEQA